MNLHTWSTSRLVDRDTVEGALHEGPSHIRFVVVLRSSNGRARVIVQNDDPAGLDDSAQEIEVDEDLMKSVTAVHERGVSSEAAHDLLRERLGGALQHQPCDRVQAGRLHMPPPDV